MKQILIFTLGLLFLSGCNLANTTTNICSPKMIRLTKPRMQHTAITLLNGQVAIFGGKSPNRNIFSPNHTVEIFDPTNNSITPSGKLIKVRLQDSIAGGANIDSVNTGTYTLLNTGKVLILGGIEDITNPHNTVSAQNLTAIANAEIYDPLLKRSQNIQNLSEPRAQHTATLLPDGQVLIVGGQGKELPICNTCNQKDNLLDSVEIFNPKTKHFKTISKLHTGRAGHSATLLKKGYVLIHGGEVSTTKFSDFDEIYNPKTKTFQLIPIPHRLIDIMPLKNGNALFYRPCDPTMSKENFIKYNIPPVEFDPETYKTTVHSKLYRCNGFLVEYKGDDSEDVVIPTQKVLYIGGVASIQPKAFFKNQDSEAKDKILLYDPFRGHYNELTPLALKRRLHSVSLLKDGRVFVAGGHNGISYGKADVWDSIEIIEIP